MIAWRSHLRSMLRRVESADVEGLRVLLARARKKRVTLEQAQAVFDKALLAYRAKSAARKRSHRARQGEGGTCTRCGAQARPNRTTCTDCNENSKDAVYAKRGAQREARNDQASKDVA